MPGLFARPAIGVAVVCFAILASGCATSPTGRTQLMLISESQAIAASRQAYLQLMQPLADEGRINTDARVFDRVKRLTSPIIAQAIAVRPETQTWDWQIQVIDDPDTVNAWAMAGGKMAVYTGLIDQLQLSDDELAQVIAHEVAHALAKHSAEKMSIAAATQVGMTAVAIAADQRPVVLQGAALLAGLAVELPYSRSMETEADRIGIELAARAGFDPRAAVSLWDKMIATERRAPPQYLSTHPNPAARRGAAAELVPSMLPLYQAAGERSVYPL